MDNVSAGPQFLLFPDGRIASAVFNTWTSPDSVSSKSLRETGKRVQSRQHDGGRFTRGLCRAPTVARGPSRAERNRGR